MKLPASVAAIGQVDEDRVRKIAADNPDLLHARLATRFGISVGRLRKIIGASNAGELLKASDMAGAHYPRRMTSTHQGLTQAYRSMNRRDEMRKKLRAQEDATRPGWKSKFEPMRRPNGRGGPADEDSR